MSKVVVIGSANIDIVYSVERLPRLGETVAGHDITKLPGGKGLNQAVASARVIDETIFLGSFGNNNSTEFLKASVNEDSLNLKHLKASDKEAGTAIITLCDNDNTIVVIPSANDDVDIEYIKANLDLITKDSVVVLQNEIRQEVNEFIIDYCYDNQITLIYNPAPARKIDLALLEKVTYFTPNETEADYIFDGLALDQIIQKYPNKVIVTVGKDGVVYFDDSLINIKPTPVDVVDTTGAGDTLNGIMASCLSQGLDLFKALEVAVNGATKSITKFGAQGGMPRRKDKSDENKWDFE